EVLVGIERQALVEPEVHRIGVGGEQDRVAVRLRMGRKAEADVAAGAAAVLDDEGLAGLLLQGGGDDAGDDVGRTARRVGHHDLDRALRIGRVGRAHAQQRRRRDAGRERARAPDDRAPRQARPYGESRHRPPLHSSGVLRDSARAGSVDGAEIGRRIGIRPRPSNGVPASVCATRRHLWWRGRSPLESGAEREATREERVMARRLTVAAVLLGLVIPSAQAEPEKVTVRLVRAIAQAPFYIAVSKGYFTQEGIAVDAADIRSALDTIGPLATGQLDISMGAATAGFFNAANKGFDLRVIAAMGIQGPVMSTQPLVRKD